MTKSIHKKHQNMKNNVLLLMAFGMLGSMIMPSCHHDNPNPYPLEVKYKNLKDGDGNYYETGKLVFDGSNNPTGVKFDNEVMLENLTTGAKSDGSSSMTTDPNIGSPVLSVGCYKNIRVNCDTLGALYSAQQAIGVSIADLAGQTKNSSDSDGDGFDDASVRAAIIAAGYNPDYFTISPAYDPSTGKLGVTVNDTVPSTGILTKEGFVTGSSNKNLTYGIITNNGKTDTLYAVGTGINPEGEPKLVIPDLSKINYASLIPVKSSIKGSCPQGWHIPTDGEFKQLEMALGMSGLDANKEGIENDRGGKENIGNKLAIYLKLKYAGYWSVNNTFAQVGEVDVFWTSTAGKDEYGRDYVWIRYIDTLAHKGVIRKKHYDKSAFSVRCFKD